MTSGTTKPTDDGGEHGLGATLAGAQSLIAARCARLAEHPFLRRLEKPGSVHQAQLIARGIAFFVMGFQDVTRLIGRSTRDPELAALATATHLDDKGHDLWFLQDLDRLGAQVDVVWLFSDAHASARDATYSQIADVLRAEYDSSRFAVGLALEAMADIFFSRMVEFIARAGLADGLKYFGRHHQEVEQNHQVFQSDAQLHLMSVALSRAAWTELEAVVERSVTAVEAMATQLEACLTREPRSV
jgi:hypothetical protein